LFEKGLVSSNTCFNTEISKYNYSSLCLTINRLKDGLLLWNEHSLGRFLKIKKPNKA